VNAELTSAVAPHVVPFGVVFARVGGLFLLAPVLGGDSIPVRVRALLALALALVTYPALPMEGQVPVTLDMASLAPLLATELLIGLSIGALATLPLLAVQAGGQFISQQMALAIASVFDPTTNASSDLVGQALMFLLLTLFLSLGGLEVMIGAVVRSFELVPLGGFTLGRAPLDAFVGLMGAAYETAVRISAPVVCIIFVETLATGMIMKTVPQLNILSFGFPVKILVGLGMLVGSLVYVNAALDGLVEHTFGEIAWWVEDLRTLGEEGGGLGG